mgnify:CR=1 FL=1|jgi:hypothetical protein|tara:strand:- start:616 stop:1074 length:459 start_codon:yes stop_codon:yes gene_type:complete
MTIYVDMDGVIADFESWIMSILPDITEDDWRYNDGPWNVMADNVDIIYRNLKPLHLLPHFNNLYQVHGDVKFLSAIPTQWFGTEKWDKAVNNKVSWLLNHIDDFLVSDAIFTKGASDKINYMKPGDILYDDRQDTVDAWTKAGGVGIHVKGR